MPTINTNRVTKRNRYTKHTDWKQYQKICNSYPITQNITTKEEIDTQIYVLQSSIRQTYKKATSFHKESHKLPNPEPLLQQLMRDRNRHRRKFQKTGHPIHKLQRSLLATLIQKKINETRNFKWQRKLQQIDKTDHTL